MMRLNRRLSALSRPMVGNRISLLLPVLAEDFDHGASCSFFFYFGIF
jgi:hypothetical protein